VLWRLGCGGGGPVGGGGSVAVWRLGCGAAARLLWGGPRRAAAYRDIDHDHDAMRVTVSSAVLKRATTMPVS
jgi:hypothetical protein